ncbi:MAG: lysophospholipase [Bryobacteraceae bacterium]|nr:lysophospholipase [Bryobacteraceae bacterium]
MTWRRNLVLGFAVSLAGIALGVRALERMMTYRPPAQADPPPPPPDAQEKWIPFGDRRLHAWYFAAPTPSGVILYSHGNGGSVAGLAALARQVNAQGFNIVLWDYPGYGRTGGALPANEAELFASGAAVYDYFAAREPLYVWGQSLGSTVSADLCTRRPCRALVMESGLSSARRYAETRVPWIPTFLHVFAANQFASAEKLAHVKCPTLIAHGTADRTIDYTHAQELYAASQGNPKRLLTIPSGSHWLPGEPQFVPEVARFLRSSTR